MLKTDLEVFILDFTRDSQLVHWIWFNICDCNTGLTCFAPCHCHGWAPVPTAEVVMGTTCSSDIQAAIENWASEKNGMFRQTSPPLLRQNCHGFTKEQALRISICWKHFLHDIHRNSIFSAIGFNGLVLKEHEQKEKIIARNRGFPPAFYGHFLLLILCYIHTTMFHGYAFDLIGSWCVNPD